MKTKNERGDVGLILLFTVALPIAVGFFYDEISGNAKLRRLQTQQLEAIEAQKVQRSFPATVYPDAKSAPKNIECVGSGATLGKLCGEAI